MPSIRLPLRLVLPILAAGVAFAARPAHAASETRPVAPFDAIVISAAADLRVEVDPGATPEVRVEASSKLLPRVVTEVKDGRLHIDVRGRGGWFGSGPDVHVRVPSLKGLHVDGAVQADIRGLTGEMFVLDADGAGEVRLAGRVGRLLLDVDGACDVDAFDLQAEDVRVRLDGAAGIQVCSAGVLDAEISGVGHIDYDCAPTRVRRDVNGVGRIEPR